MRRLRKSTAVAVIAVPEMLPAMRTLSATLNWSRVMGWNMVPKSVRSVTVTV